MITDLGQVTESRLCWPENKPRAARRVNSPFRRPEVASAVKRIEDEMTRWGIRAYIVSRNNQRIYAGDPATAVWWQDKKKAVRVLACDKYDTLGSNLHALYLTLDAMRALERWGAYTAEQAAEGARLALPPPATPKTSPWWIVIPGVMREWPLPAIKGMYHDALKVAHPDVGGTAERVAELTAAFEDARREKEP